MSISDRHIYLYAKHWYKETNLINDMKVIIGERSRMHPEDVDMIDIKTVLLDLVQKHLQIENESKFVKFIGDVEKYGVVQACIYVLRYVEPKNIGFDLGSPDSNILPLNKTE